VPGVGGDSFQTLWRLENQAHFLRLLGNQGFRVWLNALAEQLKTPQLVNVSTVPWLPLQMIGGSLFVYNLAWWLSYVLGGWALAWLVYNYTRQWLASAVAGFFYVFAPWHVVQSWGHFGAMQVQWLPLLAWAALRWGQTGKRRYLFAAVVFGVFLGWTEHHFLFFAALAAGVIFFLAPHRVLKLWWRSSLRWWSLGGLLLGVILALGPYLPTIILALTPQSFLQVEAEEATKYATDLLSPLTPPFYHPLWGQWFSFLWKRFSGNLIEATTYLTFTALAVIAWVSWRRRIILRFWLAFALIFLVLSWGPSLQIAGWQTGLPLPSAFLRALPGLDIFRAFGRFQLLVLFAVAVMLGRSLVALTPRARCLASALLALELALPFPLPELPAQKPAAYDVFIPSSNPRVVDVGAAEEEELAGRAWWYLAEAGGISLGNPSMQRAIAPQKLWHVQRWPGLRELLFYRPEAITAQITYFNQPFAETLSLALRKVGAEAVVVHRDFLSPPEAKIVENFLREQLLFPLAARDEKVAIFRVVASARAAPGVIIPGREWIHQRRKDGKIVSAFRRQAEVIVVGEEARRLRWRGYWQSEQGGVLRVYLAGKLLEERELTAGKNEWDFVLDLRGGREQTITFQVEGEEKLVFHSTAVRWEDSKLPIPVGANENSSR
jgi:hypothetical protein